MSGSARLGLALLAPGQAQKEFHHNEALQLLDLLTAAAVEEGPRPTPPSSPALGTCFIVGSPATGAWAGKEQSLAGFTSGGWRFIEPQPGMFAFVKSANLWATFIAGAWEVGLLRGSSLKLGGLQVVGPRQSAISDPSGGSTVDTEGRASIDRILAALRAHGLIAA